MFKWLFNKKRKRKEKELLEKYERGEYLRLNEDIDNKELIAQHGDVIEKQVEPEPVPVIEPIVKPKELLPHQKAEIDIRNKLKRIIKKNG